MNSYEIQRRDLLALLRSTTEIAHSRGAAESEQRLAGAMRRFRTGGWPPWSAGSSSEASPAFSAPCSRSPACSLDVDIATNMVTMISYGPAELINAILISNGEEEAVQITRADIPQYVTEQQNRGNVKNVRLLTIETPSEKLATGLTFVDTPGVGALNHEHTTIT